MDKKKSILIYSDFLHKISKLSDEQAGKLFKGLLNYSNGITPEFDDILLDYAFEDIKTTIDRDSEKYLLKCLKNKEIAIERERIKRERNNTNVHERTRIITNSTDRDNDNDNDNDIDSDKDIDILDYYDSLPSDVLNEKLKDLKTVSDNEKIDFSVFWELYGKKKGNKLKVEKKWNKLSLSTQEKIIETLPNFKKPISDIQFLPFPETYLNNERWNDEIEETLQEEKTGYVRQYDWDSYLKTLEDE